MGNSEIGNQLSYRHLSEVPGHLSTREPVLNN